MEKFKLILDEEENMKRIDVGTLDHVMGDKFNYDYESNIYTFKFNGKKEEFIRN